jgi:UDP-glucose 4-epimerase
VAEANLRALEWTARHNGCLTLNVGPARASAFVDVVAPWPCMSGKRFTYETAQRREGDPLSIVADTRLITERFNWTPQYDLNAMVEHAIRWEKTL